MDLGLSGRTAAVAAASAGLGLAAARALAAEGVAVAVCGRDRARVEEAARAVGGDAVPLVADVGTPEGATAFVDDAVAALGRVDILVPNAGGPPSGTFESTPLDAYVPALQLNLLSTVAMCQAAVPAMVERGWGRLVFTTSHGALGTLGNPIFASAMGGVISLAKAIAHEHRDRGVTVNCLAPGATTRLAEVTLPAFEEQHRLGVLDDAEWASIQAGPGPASHVAPIVAWLCSPAADGVTGEVFHAAGGLVGRWSAYEEPRSIYRGDHRAVGPWTLDELDQLVPGQLLT
jgi:3-oxoacyl-[acyl-carrier protein] reductase